MKSRSTLLITTLLILIIATILPIGSAYADTSLLRKPARYKTIIGADSGNPVSVIQVHDQSQSQDDPSKYVLFSTPGAAYRGVQEFSLSKSYQPGDVTRITLTVNFNGPSKRTQAWIWKLYDWNARKWVNVGDNAKARPGVWVLLKFDLVDSPRRFINSNGRIRVQLNSNNLSQDAKIDYEILRVTVAPSSGCGAELNAAFEDQVMTLVNAERAKEGIAPMRQHDKLDSAAQRHSNDMACNNFMSHIGSDGSNSWDRISQAGYSYWMMAENIAAWFPSAESVVEGWMCSEGHKTNILNPDLEEIGIAYAFKSSARYGHYWTTDFGTRK